jgi:Protein of unknown function (DUF3098)
MAKTVKSTAPEAAKKTEDNSHPIFAFGKENYILMLIGVGLIIFGFILMTGGGSKDPNVFNEEMFDFRRLTLAPILILIGFAVEIVAIMKRPKD